MIRPSDEDILRQQERIQEQIQREQPLVGFLEPVALLREEYSHDPGSLISANLGCLPNGATMRRVRGDGNCLFRAVAFEFCVQLASNTGGCDDGDDNAGDDQHGDGKLKAFLMQAYGLAGFDCMATEDFVDDLLSSLRDCFPSRGSVDGGGRERLAELWRADESRSHAVVVVLRLLASAYLRTHAAHYVPFLDTSTINLQIHPQTDLPKHPQTDLPKHQDAKEDDDAMIGTVMARFCQQCVECMGVESDNVHIEAVVQALRARVQLWCLDGAPEPVPFEPTAFQIDDPFFAHFPSILQRMPLQVNMLYRPGHYDLLYLP
jgi:ubiquitin thioesterase protein OTUB1